MQLFDAALASLALALACGLAAAQRHDEAGRHEARRCAWQLAQLGAGALRSAEAEREVLAAGQQPCRRLDAQDLRRQGELPFALPSVNSYGQTLEAYACVKEGRTYGIALARGLPRQPAGASGAERDADVQRRLYRAFALPFAQALAGGCALPPAGLPGQGQGAQALADFGLPDPGPGSVFAVLQGSLAGSDADYLRRARTPGLEDRSAMTAPLSLQGHAAAGAASLQLLPLQQGRLLQAGSLVDGAKAFAEACRQAPADATGSLASLDGRLAFAWTPAADQAGQAGQEGQDGQDGQHGEGVSAGTPPPGSLLACLASKPRSLAASPALFQPREARTVLQGGLVPKPWCPRGSRPRLDLLPAASGGSTGSAPGTHVLTRLEASADASAGGLVLNAQPASEEARIEGVRVQAEDAGEAWRVRLERRRTSSARSLGNWGPLSSWRGVLCQNCLVRDAVWEEDPDASVLALVSCTPESQAGQSQAACGRTDLPDSAGAPSPAEGLIAGLSASMASRATVGIAGSMIGDASPALPCQPASSPAAASPRAEGARP